MQPRYDVSEFGPQENKELYDVSEFGPSEEKKVIEKKEAVKPKKRNLLQMISENPLNPIAQIKAIPQEFQDLLGMIGSGAQKLGQAPSEISGAYNLLKENPMQAGRAALAGLPTMGHELLNMPSDIGNYLQRLGMAPEELTKIIPRQKDITEDIKKTFKLTGSPGEALLTGLVSNIPNIAGAGAAGKIVKNIVTSPLKLTAKNITKDILKSEKLAEEKFSGPKGLYTQQFEKARNLGLGDKNKTMWDLLIDPKKIDLEGLSPTPEHRIEPIKNYIENPTLENGQKAISQLGHIERNLKKRTSLEDFQKRQLNAAIKAKKYIGEQMFTDNNGKFYPELLKEHKEIQKGYAKEVIPYSEEPNLKRYKEGKIEENKLINSLANKKFGKKIREKHPEIKQREMVKKVLGSKVSKGALIGTGIGAGLGITGASNMLKSLLGK